MKGWDCCRETKEIYAISRPSLRKIHKPLAVLIVSIGLFVTPGSAVAKEIIKVITRLDGVPHVKASAALNAPRKFLSEFGSIDVRTSDRDGPKSAEALAVLSVVPDINGVQITERVSGSVINWTAGASGTAVGTAKLIMDIINLSASLLR